MTENWAAGAGLLPNGAGLVYKVLGMESEVVSAQVRAFWGIARRIIRGAELPAKVFA